MSSCVVDAWMAVLEVHLESLNSEMPHDFTQDLIQDKFSRLYAEIMGVL